MCEKILVDDLYREFENPTSIDMRVKNGRLFIDNTSRHLTKKEIRKIIPRLCHSMILSNRKHLVLSFSCIERGIRQQMGELLECEWESNLKVYKMKIHRDVQNPRLWHLYTNEVEVDLSFTNTLPLREFIKRRKKPNKEDVARSILQLFPNITQLSLDTAINRVIKSWKEAHS